MDVLLFIMCKDNHLSVVKYLIEEAHVDKKAKDDEGLNALHYASEEDNLDIVKYLIEEANFGKESKDNVGETALHLTSQ